MAPRLFKAADVCEMVQVQPYVLRSWEKEFPGIGLQRGDDSARLYRQSDVDQVLRIKQLVFGEGLTLAGARRKLEEMSPLSSRDDDDDSEVLDALKSNARTRIARVRQGLQSILTLLSSEPGTMSLREEYQLEPPPVNVRTSGKARASASRTQPAPVAARKRG